MADNGNTSPAGSRIPFTSRILYADEHCVVVNKLQGEAVEGAAAGMADLPLLLERYLAEEASGGCYTGGGGNERLSPPVAVNRLDVPVSGCALFARTRRALAILNNAFAAGENSAAADENSAVTDNPSAVSAPVEKYYWAIIEKPAVKIPRTARLIHWLQFDAVKNKSRAFNESGPGRKKAVLSYRIIGEGRNYLFLEVRLFTGRHHQIRSQFEHMGLHIKGDLKYSARRSDPSGGIRLHARSLVFPAPSGSGRISVCADPPAMDTLWQAFADAEKANRV